MNNASVLKYLDWKIKLRYFENVFSLIVVAKYKTIKSEMEPDLKRTYF